MPSTALGPLRNSRTRFSTPMPPLRPIKRSSLSSTPRTICLWRNPLILRRDFEVGELLARLPQPLLCIYVVGLFEGGDHLPVRVVSPAHPFDLGRGGEVDQ